MKVWELHISYQQRPHTLKAELVYHSDQVMRIRVYGKTSSILLENNYPYLHKLQSRKGMKWQIREGSFQADAKESSELLMNILKQLEYLIKKEYPMERLMFE